MIKYKKGIIPKFKPTTKYNDNIYVLDLENSNGWVDEKGNVIGYNTKLPDKFFLEHEAVSLMYIWQFSINEVVYYGRTYDELYDFINELSEKHFGSWIYIYVHNLSHEFVFLNNIFDFKSEHVFARKSHKIIYARVPNKPIEFRCSYFLSGLSLANWGKKLGLPKKIGDLDYDTIRTPMTQLTEKELGYCETDCLVVYKGIKKMLEKYEHIAKIPYTQTGEIRQEYKKRISSNFSLMKKLQGLIPTEEVYSILKKCFRGGDTHANYLHVRKVKKNVCSKDIASSYPTVMISERFPMTTWERWYKKEHDENHAYLMHLKLYGVDEKHCCHYIPKSKCEKVYRIDENGKEYEPLVDNGRIITADFVEMWVTNIDFGIIVRTYNIEKIEIIEEYSSRLAYLPQELREFILELFQNKTELKDVDGKEDLYMQSKQFINSLYGMSVTDLINDELEFVGDGYNVNQRSYEENVAPYRNKLYKNFLSYSWGVFVTAYARQNLWKAIEEIKDDVVYYDTDSVKYIGNYEKFFEKYNDEITEKLQKSTENLKGDFTAKDKKGKIHSLGIFEDEGISTEFKTLGAKRYVARKNDKLHMTLAGVAKSAVSVLENDINKFDDNLFFPRDISGKKIVTHSYNQPHSKWIDKDGNVYISKEKCGVNIRNSSYSLNILEEFLAVLELL